MPGTRAGAGGVVAPGVAAMNRLKSQVVASGAPVADSAPERDEFGRLVAFTGTGFKNAGDIVSFKSLTAVFGAAGDVITYGQGTVKPVGSSGFVKPTGPPQSFKEYTCGMDEATLPGDLLVRKSGLPIKSLMAALIRQRSLDMAGLMLDFLQRPGFSRLPPRGHALVDVPTFRRALAYAFGEQWLALGMTSPEFLQCYSPYIVREQTESGDALVSWKPFCVDIMKAAGVDKGDLGYLKAEASLDERASTTLQEQGNLSSDQRAELQRVVDAEFSHDIVTEEEAQQAVLKDVERVTGARSVAVARYGSYESKAHGRNQLGVVKHA